MKPEKSQTRETLRCEIYFPTCSFLKMFLTGYIHLMKYNWNKDWIKMLLSHIWSEEIASWTYKNKIKYEKWKKISNGQMLFLSRLTPEQWHLRPESRFKSKLLASGHLPAVLGKQRGMAKIIWAPATCRGGPSGVLDYCLPPKPNIAHVNLHIEDWRASN